MLAAIVCLLIRRGKAIVYLPDCHRMLADSGRYLTNALLLTFFRNEYFHDEIIFLALTDGLSNSEMGARLDTMCNSAANLELFLVFVIDQANVLDDVEGGRDRFSSVEKAYIRTFLDKITARHMKFASSTANYLHAAFDKARETSERRISFHSSLDEVINSPPPQD
jgi:hypothetical protein